MNNLNLMLMIQIGHLGMLIEDMNKKLLTMKIIERSKSLREKVNVWLNQIAKGVSEILKYAHTGIKEYQKIEKRAFLRCSILAWINIKSRNIFLRFLSLI